MSALPTGTVTLLFTDVQGSTDLLSTLGPGRYEQALGDHRRLLREAFARHEGVEVDTQGDAFLVAFGRARSAVRAAADAQLALEEHAWPDGRQLRVRMGVHTCDATPTPEGYVGIGVHRGARICAAGHGGQVLLSHTTHDLLEDEGEEHDGFTLLDLGEHRLKDLTRPQRLFQLVIASLPREFPPLRTLENRPTNLPVQPTALIGRDRELGEVVGALRSPRVRLLTLTGPGGAGKTRLALQAAAELVEEFPNGVFVVALAAIADPALVVPEIAQTIGVSEAVGQSFEAYLAPKKLLLVVDNLEQVIAVAPQLAVLLEAAPDVKLLATSREPLRVAAEHVYPVPPLGLPDLSSLPEATALSQYEAVALFLDRAQTVQPDFEVSSENAPAVAEICVRLDGLPLALELAAARIRLLSPEAILERLGERLRLLTGGVRDAPGRHQTLRGTLTWSHDLLDDDERVLFARLGVFAGGFSLDTAEAVCSAELETVASLVDKSLVRRDGDRFAMLETIREFSLEQLVESREQDAVQARHAAYFEALAERAYLERYEHEGDRAVELELAHDDLRAALDWLGRADRQRHLALAGALGWFWHVRSHFAEGRARLEEALADASQRDRVHARALSAAGELAAWAGDLPAALQLIEQANAIWRALGQEQEAAFTLHELGWGYFFAGDDQAARRCMEESLALQESVGERFHVNRARIGLIQVLVSLGELDLVEPMAREALEVSRELHDLRSEHFAVHFLADCALIRGESAAAETRYHRALELAVELADRSETAFELQGMAMAAAVRSSPTRALRFLGAAAAELDALAIDVSAITFWSDLVERHQAMARDELGAEAAGEAWQEGRQLGFERAVAEALGDGPS